MAYFKATAQTQYVGTSVYYKIEAENEQEALEIFKDTAVEHIDSYRYLDDNEADVENDEDDEDVETEYDYFVVEITKEEYDNLDYETLD